MQLDLTIILIIITVATTIYGWNNDHLQTRWMFNPYAAHHARQYYRFLSSGFIHSNTLHLLFNMIALFFFGDVLERIYVHLFGTWGLAFYLITYLLGIIVANTRTFYKYKDRSYYNSLGASGGVASILFASILYRPTSSICLYFAICLPAFILGIAYLIYSYYSGHRKGDNVNHDAHLYGALFGIAFTILIRPVVVLEFFERIKNFNLYEFQFLSVFF
ncbi:MAG: rhomboid family intramembrane serine protease [Cyclobacteriaceae bacterium]|nr:rhomboid family intramembrane serine protease [Cyclobacteriaceae bacterium]